MNYVALSKQEMLFKIKKFLDSGSVAESGLDKFLFDSWQRSYYAEVDPYQTIPYVAYKIAAKGHKNHYTSFISVCQPVITQTFNIIKGSGFHLFLIDNDACLLESFPLTRTVIYNWSEESLGTNAAGTALATRKAVQINGSEHYCYGLHGYTTTAAPIFDDGGNLLGALCLIGPVNEDHSHVLSALAKAADKITDSLRIDKLNCQYFSVSQSLHKLIENITDGVLVLSGNGVIECVNPAAKDILGKNDTEIMGLHIFDLLSTVKSENLAVEEPFFRY